MIHLVTFDCNITGPGAEKRSVRELAASLSKHGGPEPDSKRKGGSCSESGQKTTTDVYAICISLLFMSVSCLNPLKTEFLLNNIR
jgi:hypothetical protein